MKEFEVEITHNNVIYMGQFEYTTHFSMGDEKEFPFATIETVSTDNENGDALILYSKGTTMLEGYDKITKDELDSIKYRLIQKALLIAEDIYNEKS